MRGELSRLLPAHQVDAQELEYTVEASPAECASLAERMQLPAVHWVRCRFRLHRVGAGVIAADGRLRARVTQTCVVSLEDFDADIGDDFRVRFVPAGTEQDDIDVDAEDELTYEHDTIDLGEATAEQLALALDPWPRRPGAALPVPAAEPQTHPFAALARLKGQADRS